VIDAILKFEVRRTNLEASLQALSPQLLDRRRRRHPCGHQGYTSRKESSFTASKALLI
jgi:hypothetical protein